MYGTLYKQHASLQKYIYVLAHIFHFIKKSILFLLLLKKKSTLNDYDIWNKSSVFLNLNFLCKKNHILTKNY